jgi:hypothetical protein
VERAFDYARTVYYRPGFTADATSDPLRISVESVLSDATVESFLGSYVSLGTTLVKGARATYFIVSAQRRDSHARHGVTWSPQPGRRVTIYGYADESYLVRLAASATPARNG